MTLDDIRTEATRIAENIDRAERWAAPVDVAKLARLVAELCSQISSATDPRRFE